MAKGIALHFFSIMMLRLTDGCNGVKEGWLSVTRLPVAGLKLYSETRRPVNVPHVSGNGAKVGLERIVWPSTKDTISSLSICSVYGRLAPPQLRRYFPLPFSRVRTTIAVVACLMSPARLWSTKKASYKGGRKKHPNSSFAR